MGWLTILKICKELLFTYPRLEGNIGLAAAHHCVRSQVSYPLYQYGACRSRVDCDMTHIGNSRSCLSTVIL